MNYYHCSPVARLKLLEPRKPEAFSKPKSVYLTILLPMALMYGIRNYEYSYGYTKEGQIYYDEYFPNALEVLYKGKSASLYLCKPREVSTTAIPNEAVSEIAVPVIEEIRISDVYEALLEQEQIGALVIRRYHELPPKTLAWVCKVEADTIREKNLIHAEGAMADYYRTHYPESWKAVLSEYSNPDCL